MNARRPDITPDTKVGALLEHYPEVEETLIGLSPEFRRLKNPILRRTLARIATLRQVARIGEVPLGTLITRLRDAAGMLPGGPGAGQEDEENSMSHSDPSAYAEKPDWVGEPLKSFDAREIIEGGGHPLETVMKDLAALPDKGIYELVTPFVPAPLIDMARGRGFEAWSAPPDAGIYRTFFRRA
jgi:hypothetical protein